ncbi:hypothetical protein M011DRAFT_451796 [Sporormia fimetaria CBS 119925]|uniref:Uncharacterized protein n=1 Tax=Sporormia fimetaria CBS 119925 TaxID=1340428 RepID=A0A6A6UYA5_9PLEO|nr:hypothetical protein M011DRAFT_451796 [Sporormia fimetaria CBS 119925]
MADSASSSSSAEAGKTSKTEATATIKIAEKVSQRQGALIGLVVCLNVLLWCSILVLLGTFYLVVEGSKDATLTLTAVLTILSSFVSIGYVVLHTIFSLKQRLWRHQHQRASIQKKTSYVAVRIVGPLCVLWLLTAGWNMITVARRPRCLPDISGFAKWESGTTCIVARISVAFSSLALMASCAVFGMLAVLRRPFEAHVFRYRHRERVQGHLTPAPSRGSSPARSYTSSKIHSRMSSVMSSVTHIRNLSNSSVNIDNSNPQSTSSSTPTGYPSTPHKMAPLVTPSGFIPLSTPQQYSHSVWRAVHPTLPSPLGPRTSRSYSNLPNAVSGPQMYARSRYSRSSISLTRPHRLSMAAPPGSDIWSDHSVSTGPEDEGANVEAGGHSEMSTKRASASEIAYALLNGTAIPGTHSVPNRSNVKGHVRHSSAPDGAQANTTAGAAEEMRTGRMALGWKPELRCATDTDVKERLETKRQSVMVRSASQELLSLPDLDSSPDGSLTSLRKELEKDLDCSGAQIWKSQSESLLRAGTGLEAEEKDIAGRVSRMPQRPKIPKRGSDERSSVSIGDSGNEGAEGKRARRLTMEESKNKPLPKIAVL